MKQRGVISMKKTIKCYTCNKEVEKKDTTEWTISKGEKPNLKTTKELKCVECSKMPVVDFNNL